MEESTVKEALPRVEQQNPQEPELANKLPDKLQSKEDFYESVILVLQECFIYKIPPRMGIAGYKASEWDVTKFIWSGRLRIIVQGKDCIIKLEDKTNGELFVACPYTDEKSVEAVLDSSRYFVIKVVDLDSGRHAFLGLGFAERSDAFDFNVALQDFLKRARNEVETKKLFVVDGPKADYSLKEGESININIPNMHKRVKSPSEKESSNSDIVALPPPPRPATAYYNPTQEQRVATTAHSATTGYEEFGDFVADGDTTEGTANWTKF